MRPFSDVLRTKRLLVFDLDGTLADTAPLHAEAFVQAFRGLDVIVDYERIAGLATEDAVRRVLHQHQLSIPDSQVDEIVRSKRKIARSLILQGELRPLPGAKEFVQAASFSYALALYSSGSTGTVALSLTQLGLSGSFNPVLTASDVSCAKPDPEGYLAVMAARRAECRDTMIFEDSAAGIEAARRAGVDVVQIDISCRHPKSAAASIWQMDWLSACQALENAP